MRQLIVSEPVLDSSALLAFLLKDSGAETVEQVLPGGIISAINLAEVISKLCEMGAPAERAWEAVEETGVQVIATDAMQACEIGGLRPPTRHLGLSLGDRACLALARRLERTVYTADRAWTKLAGFDITLIRG